jgi:hypothetical protein
MRNWYPCSKLITDTTFLFLQNTTMHKNMTVCSLHHMIVLAQSTILMWRLECWKHNHHPTQKYYTSQNVLAAINFGLKFTYVLAGWEEPAHDSSILDDSLSRHDGIQISDGNFYLENIGYACWPGILPPFIQTRYHLNKFSSRNRPCNAYELFNLTHSSLRINTERTFAALKNRFKILD